MMEEVMPQLAVVLVVAVPAPAKQRLTVILAMAGFAGVAVLRGAEGVVTMRIPTEKGQMRRRKDTPRRSDSSDATEGLATAAMVTNPFANDGGRFRTTRGSLAIFSNAFALILYCSASYVPVSYSLYGI
jgi:hypothetical protein